MFKKIKNKIQKMVACAQAAFKKAVNTILAFTARSRFAMASQRGEGFVDSGVKILIAVVIGALLLAGLYLLFGETILPTLTTKIKNLFNYTA